MTKIGSAIILVLLHHTQFVSSLTIKQNHGLSESYIVQKVEQVEQVLEKSEKKVERVLEKSEKKVEHVLEVAKQKVDKVFEAITHHSIRKRILEGDEKEPTLLRQLPLRLLGYANEVGESFKPLVGWPIYVLSYVISITYVGADTGHQGWIVHDATGGTNLWLVVKAAIDAFIWQMLASVIVSGFVVNRVVFLSDLLLQKLTKGADDKRKNMFKWLPTMMGMLSIPLIVKPIDTGVSLAMDYTVRLLL